MPRSIVAIVGRPNVGKSTLFNRLVGWRKAIVDPISGLTRDRLYGVCEWRGHEFTVVDTAGLEMDAMPVADREFSQADIEAQTRIAIEEANAIVFLLDVRQGLTAIDRDIAQLLRRSGRPVIVAANKADTFGQEHFRHEILELGFPEVLMVSAEHGIGVDDLLDRVLDNLPPTEAEVGEEEAARIAIMGRPNVGKSSLLNALLGDERALVSDVPGTTRDPIDTAGIRRRAAARDRLERFSLLRGIKAMERADAVLLVMEAPTGILTQDQHVASYTVEAGKGLVFVINKVDLVDGEEKTAAAWKNRIARSFKFLPHAPLVLISAKTGAGVRKVLPAALEVVGRRRTRIPTNELNKVLREAMTERPPPSFKGKRLQLNFATQAESDTPTVVLFVNDVGLLHFSYRRYLENKLRERFGFQGNPLRIVLRQEKK